MEKIEKKWILVMQIMVMVYSFVGVLAKISSEFLHDKGFFSFQFIGTVFAMFCILGFYAIIWQVVLKHMQLSIAYANKGFCLFWTLLWSVLFFAEKVTWTNIIGIVIIVSGIMVVTSSNE